MYFLKVQAKMKNNNKKANIKDSTISERMFPKGKTGKTGRRIAVVPPLHEGALVWRRTMQSKHTSPVQGGLGQVSETVRALGSGTHVCQSGPG